MTMAKKRRPGVAAPGPAEAVASNDGNYSTAARPKGEASYKTSSTGNGPYALGYAKTRGWYVFPAPVGEKKSHKSAKHSGGRNWGATIDEKEIKRDFKRWSKANIGVVTGPDSKIFVVEADTVEGHGVDGIASLEELQQKHGELPHTLVAESPSGSLHHYFNYPSNVEIRCSTSKIAEGVDVKGAGGMVIAPPSRKSNGQQYGWLYDWPIADAPAWLIELCAAGGDGAAAPDKPAEELLADDIDKLAYAVGVIPNNLPGYKEWKNFGLAIFAATAGSDFGFSLFDGFSRSGRTANMTVPTFKRLGSKSAARHQSGLAQVGSTARPARLRRDGVPATRRCGRILARRKREPRLKKRRPRQRRARMSCLTISPSWKVWSTRVSENRHKKTLGYRREISTTKSELGART
jgi:Bifunctional DNA primase/polymerase, N-terminal